MPDLELDVKEPGGQPDDLNGIGETFENSDITEQYPGPERSSGLKLPDQFLEVIISAPFNVGNAFFGKCCPPLNDQELKAGVEPIKAWIEEETAGMGIENPTKFMALLWLGTAVVPRAIAIVGEKAANRTGLSIVKNVKEVEIEKPAEETQPGTGGIIGEFELPAEK